MITGGVDNWGIKKYIQLPKAFVHSAAYHSPDKNSKPYGLVTDFKKKHFKNTFNYLIFPYKWHDENFAILFIYFVGVSIVLLHPLRKTGGWKGFFACKIIFFALVLARSKLRINRNSGIWKYRGSKCLKKVKIQAENVPHLRDGRYTRSAFLVRFIGPQNYFSIL
ncbi:hypothetical protein EGR_06817 [Echinococcus granulosus]|uniref:Uncharacterized protein n=1 Tax=Echinococcus granulosus TaxID=6210 RepID=W6UB20_ECHGR|nr:hypothetical protein EGR_06817 [Echinococcus granulosus]EUB58290.1 hypothetical protein EGR_06817 [Echinococcus granulosus]